MKRCVLVLVLVLPVWAVPTALPVLAGELKSLPPASVFEDPLERLVPRRPRGELEEDRVTAAALYAEGRLLLKREDFAGALRHYQRAWRYDPQAVSILREIIELAFVLKRPGELVRYATIAAELDPKDPGRIRQLAARLSRQGQYARALRLYEKSLELEKDKKPDSSTVLVRFEMGRLYFLTGQYAKSADSFSLVRDALEHPDRFGLEGRLREVVMEDAEQTYALLAEAFLRAGRLDAAESLFRKAHPGEKNAALLALDLARVEAERGNVDAALEQLDRFFDAGTEPQTIEPYRLLAELLKKKTPDEQRARQQLGQRLEQLYQRKPNRALGLFLGRHWLETDQLQKAERVFGQLLEKEPSVSVYEGLIEVYRRQGQPEPLLRILAAAVVTMQNFQPLESAIKELLKQQPLVDQVIQLALDDLAADPPAAQPGEALAAGLLAIEARKLEAADRLLEPALADKATSPAEVVVAWGLGLLLAKDYERSARVFRRAIEQQVSSKEVPVAEVLPDYSFYLSSALALAGRTDEAVAAAERAAALAEQAAKAAAEQAVALKKAGKRREAEAAALRSEELKARVPRFLLRVPWVFYQAKQLDEAERRYVELLKRLDRDYSSPAVREAARDARLALSNICVLQERLPEAEEWLEQVLDEFPEDIGALNDLGYLWADQNKHLHRSLQMVRKAVEGEPDNVAYRDSLGWALFRLGRYEEAVEELEKAVQAEDPPDGVILDHLGDAYLKVGRRQKALATWKRAVEALREQNDIKLLKKTQAKIKQYRGEE